MQLIADHRLDRAAPRGIEGVKSLDTLAAHGPRRCHFSGCASAGSEARR